jgi:SAM-dependent methyltransferase
MEATVARWTQAMRATPLCKGRVLDLGCAFGVATRLLRQRGFDALGVDASPAYIARARRADPTGTYLLADATSVPLPDASFDAVFLLDVLEHLPDERTALAEVCRLLLPGGTLVLSVPHRSPLAWLDSLNLYAHIVRATGRGRFPLEIAATGIHRHYTVGRLRTLLGEVFDIREVQRTGLGLAELVHLPILVLFRWLVPWETAYQAAAFAYYTAYLVEDLPPLGPAGYHLLVVARRRVADGTATMPPLDISLAVTDIRSAHQR